MPRHVLAAFLFALVHAAPALAQTVTARGDSALVGTWAAEEPYFRAQIRVSRDAGGALTAHFTGDDGELGLTFSAVAVRGDSVFLAVDELEVRFAGALSAGPAVSGTWRQGAASVVLTLVPAGRPPSLAATPAAPRRPQTPVPPYPYRSETVAFRSEPSGVVLGGTLTVPDGPGPHPAVVLVSGSGQTDRDFTLDGHRSFAVIADHLARRGVATLRYDDREVGASGGTAAAMTFDDEARDVAAGMRALAARPDIDARRIGLVGHSHGGVIAPHVHSRHERAAFLVLLAAPAIRLDSLLARQNVRLALAAGMPAEDAAAVGRLVREVFRAARADTDSLVAAGQMQAAHERFGMRGEAAQQSIRAHTARGFRDVMRLDPALALGRVDVPVLVVFGTKDLDVTEAENRAPLLAALPAGADVTAHTVVGMSHWFQPATTGLADEIGRTETTVMPELLDVLAGWLRSRAAVAD